MSLNNYINYIFLLYAFLLPLSRGAITILTALLFILWLFTENFKEKVKFLKSNKTVVYLTSFVLFSLLSLLWTDNVSSGLYYVRKYWYFLPIFVIATNVEKKFIYQGISAFLLGMLISEIISYGIFFELWTTRHSSVSDPTPFMSHVQYSMFLSFTSLILLNRFFFEEQLKWKIFYFLYFLTVTSNLFLNGGRTGHVAFAVSIFIVGFLNIKNKILAFFSMLILVVSIFYAAYNINPGFKNRIHSSIMETQIINSKGSFCGSFGKRLGSWIIAVQIFLDNPILGTGATCEMSHLQEYINQRHLDMNCVKDMPSYHNNIMQTIADFGIIGLFLYLMIFYYLFKLKIKDKQYFNMLIIFISIYTISSMFETMFHSQFGEAFLALFIGIFIAKSRLENEA
ncbi:O-antigen ligase family protein [Sulfurimonas sp.]|nr:O-antigen ligase family protein [Sulfurimonas sp.]